MVLVILCVEPIYPQYSGVLETCLALRYRFFAVLCSESVLKAIIGLEYRFSVFLIGFISTQVLQYLNECVFLSTIELYNQLFAVRFKHTWKINVVRMH